jgi:hypothetical protein
MKTLLLILFPTLAVTACLAQQPPRTPADVQSPSRESLDGGYIHGAAKLYLTVRKDGTYSAGLGSCTGVDGIADGTWKCTTNRITFSPTNETKQIKGLLREADIIRDGQYWALVRPVDRVLVETNGISFQTCLKNTAVLK